MRFQPSQLEMSTEKSVIVNGVQPSEIAEMYNWCVGSPANDIEITHDGSPTPDSSHNTTEKRGFRRWSAEICAQHLGSFVPACEGRANRGTLDVKFGTFAVEKTPFGHGSYSQCCKPVCVLFSLFVSMTSSTRESPISSNQHNAVDRGMGMESVAERGGLTMLEEPFSGNESSSAISHFRPRFDNDNRPAVRPEPCDSKHILEMQEDLIRLPGSVEAEGGIRLDKLVESRQTMSKIEDSNPGPTNGSRIGTNEHGQTFLASGHPRPEIRQEAMHVISAGWAVSEQEHYSAKMPDEDNQVASRHRWLQYLCSPRSAFSILHPSKPPFVVGPWKHPLQARKGILLTDERKQKRDEKDRKKKRQHAHVRFRIHKRKAREFSLLSPESAVVQRWQAMMVVVLSYEIWAFPFRLALIRSDNATGVLVADVACDLFFLADMAVRMCTKVPAGTYPQQPDELSRPTEIARAYLRFVFPAEILPALLYHVATAFFLRRCHHGACWGWWAAAIPRMVPRAIRLRRFFKAMEQNLLVSVRALQGVKFSLIVFLSAHFVGCIFYWLARLNHLNQDTWVAQFELLMPMFNRSEASLAQLYLVCLYRGFNSLANLGYDQEMPFTSTELVFSMIVMTFQVYLSALVLGTLLNYLVAKDRLAEAHKRRLELVARFCDAKLIPQDLRDKVFKYLEFQYEKTVQSKGTVAMALPKDLEMKVADAKHRAMMEKCSARGCPFHQCDPHFLTSLLVKLRVVHVMPGEEFVSNLEIPRELYFVVHGTVHIMDDENRVKRAVRHDAPDMPPICGAEPFFLGLRHLHSLRAKGDENVKLLVLDRDDSDELSNAYPEEYELIYQNLLWAQGLDSDGNDLPGREQTDKEGDARMLRESILQSLRRRVQERFASLVCAANNGEVDSVILLARQGVNVDEIDHDGRTIMHMACTSGNYRLVEALLELGADKNVKDRWGRTPLAEAIAHRQALIVELLGQHKAQLDTPDAAGDLCQAASKGDVDGCRRLVDNGVDPCVGDYDRRTPMHVAAAEGQLKVAEYLLTRGADPNPSDRWGGTPLQDAVRGGFLAVASLLRSKGGALPAGVGAQQVREAAAAGDVRKLRLLHECGGCVENGDYDFRCPLHIAAAEGRVLAVNYLLGLSANPNVQDRKGGTPLDDAMEGGTLYHLYCAKLIAGWGGRPGRTTVTAEQVQTLEDINIEDVRILIKRLISAGYDTASSKRLSRQDLLVCMDASVRQISVVSELFSRVESIAQHLASSVVGVQEHMSALKASVISIAGSLDNIHGTRLQRRRSVEAARQGNDNSPKPSAVAHTLRVLDKLDSDACDDAAEMCADDNGVDSDEEAALYCEVDMMAEAQERSAETGVSPEKLAAKQFQKLAMKVVEVGDTFKVLCRVAASAVTENVDSPLDDEPWLTAEDVWVMLQLLGVDNVAATEPDDIMEEALAFHQMHAEHKAPPTPRSKAAPDKDTSHISRFDWRGAGTDYSGPSRKRLPVEHVVGQSFRSLRQRTLSQTSHQLAQHAADASSEAEFTLLPVSSILAGSPRFRRMLSALSVDAHLCALLESRLAALVCESEMRRLLPCRLATFRQDDILLDSAEVSNMAPSLCVLVKGECCISFANADVKGVSERLYQGDFFGARAALVPAQPAEHFVVKASAPCEILQVPIAALLRVVVATERRQCLASFMGESPQQSQKTPPVVAAGLRSPLPKRSRMAWTEADGDSQTETVRSTPQAMHAALMAGELEKRAVREFVQEMDQLWAHLSVGSSSVFRKQLFAIVTLLGEASSELFRAIFLSTQMPPSMSVEGFWRCCVDFLADELFGRGGGERVVSIANVTDSRDAAYDDENQVAEENNEAEEAAEEPTGVLSWIIRVLQGGHRLRHRFFEPEVLDLYKEAWLDVVGDVKHPLATDKIPPLLARVFIDFGHPITKQHRDEFLVDIGKDKNTKVLLWHDVDKALCDHRLGISHVVHGPFIGSALNPTWPLLAKWRVVVRLCAVYYLVMVPLRIAFLPFESMLSVGALCSDLIIDVLVSLDLLLRLNTAHRSHRNTWTTKRLKILRKVHLGVIAAAIPLDWFGFLCGASNELSCWLRLPKVFLVMVCRRSHQRQSAKLEKLDGMCRLVALLLHCSACFWYFLGRAYPSWFPDRFVSWSERHPAVQHLTFDRAEVFGLGDAAQVWERYLISLYWVFATLTVNGLVGPVIPQNLIEMAFTILLCTLNLTVVRAVLGEVSSIIMSADKEIVNARERLELVDSFVVGNELPRDLQQEIRSHFQATDSGEAPEQGAVLPLLSRSLQLQVASVTCRRHLEEIDLLRGASDMLIDSVSVLLREVTFAPGQWLFFESDSPTEMFFVVSGTVEECTTSKADAPIENVLRQHCTVGELAFFFGVRHLWSARAGRAGAACLGLDRIKFLGLMKLFPEEEETVAQNALRLMDKVNAHRSASSRASKASRARSTRSARSAAARDETDDRDGQATSVSSGRESSAVHSDAMEDMSLSGGTGKISALKQKRRVQGMLALLRECSAGNLPGVQRALDRDVQVNDVDICKRSALHVAACEGHVGVVQFLLEQRADATLKDGKGNTALNDAVRHRRDAVCAVLRESSPESALSLPGKAAAGTLCQAAADGDVDHLRRLLRNGVHVDSADYDDRTALHLAACEGHIEVVRELLDSRASVACTDRFGGTPLEDAVRHQQVQCQQLLRQRGVSLEISGRDYAGRLCEAAAEGDLETIRVLSANGVELSAADCMGRTAFHLGAACERVAVLEFLLSSQPGVDVNHTDRCGDTPLREAIRNSRPTAASMLTQAGGLPDSSGEGPLGNHQGADAKRRKRLREPAVQALASTSAERRALQWVEESLKPSTWCQTDGVLAAVRTLRIALQSVADPKNGGADHRIAAGSPIDGGRRFDIATQEQTPAPLKDRAEDALEVVLELRRRVRECASAADVEAPAHCPVWTMAARRYAEHASSWEQSLRALSQLCGVARRLIKEIVRSENRKARAALDTDQLQRVRS